MSPPESAPPDSPRDPWRDIAWGVSRGVALACLPLLLQVLPGRVPVRTDHPRLVGSPDQALAMLLLGALLGAVAGLLRPLTRYFLGSLAVGALLAQVAILALRMLVPTRPDLPPFRPFGMPLWIGVILGVALYFGELHRRTATNSLAG